MSHSLLWRHIVLLTVCVYSSNHRVLYTIGISMTRRFQISVGPSICKANKKKAYSSFIIGSRKMIRISDERAWHPQQESEAIFSKNIFFKNFRPNFRKMYFHKNACSSFIINSRIIFAYQMKGVDILY